MSTTTTIPDNTEVIKVPILYGTDKYRLTERGRQRIIEELRDELPIRCKITGVYTYDEYIEKLYEEIKSNYGLPDELMRYINFVWIINDRIHDGVLRSVNFELVNQYGETVEVAILVECEWK